MTTFLDADITEIFSVEREKLNKYWHCEKSFSETHYALFYILHGEFTAHTENSDYLLKENDILYLAKYHNYISKSITDKGSFNDMYLKEIILKRILMI